MVLLHSITFVNNLKQSKKESFERIPILIYEKARKLENIISNLINECQNTNNSYRTYNFDYLINTCIDSSLTSRTEFELNNEFKNDNKKLAYLGDAYLTFYLSISSYNNDDDQSQYQNKRNMKTNKKYLAKIYDEYFDNCLLTFEMIINGFDKSKPSTKQKCECVEAIMGSIYLIFNKIDDKFVNFVANKILNL